MRLIDLTGQRFGNLTVLGRGEDRRRRVAWDCRCDCGDAVTVVGPALKRGESTSCGCLGSWGNRQPDLTGQRFGYLVVLARAERNIGRFVAWVCKCDCGNFKTITGSSLKSGNGISCGCSRRAGQQHLTYTGAHSVVYKERGAATEHQCVDCFGQAKEWSYNHQDPNEYVGKNGKKMCPYSVDPAFYEPRCKSCHNEFDQKRAERRGLVSA